MYFLLSSESNGISGKLIAAQWDSFDVIKKLLKMKKLFSLRRIDNKYFENKSRMKIGIVGCGLIGNKRADNLGSHDKLIAVCDTDVTKAKELSKLGCSYYLIIRT